MKLATFVQGAGPELGIISEAGVIPMTRLAPELPRTMIELIASWPELAHRVRALASGAPEALPLSAVRLLAPVPRPGKIMAIGLNYADHITESGLERPAHQVWFAKAPTAVTGPYDPVQTPKVSPYVDYEVELVAVIGAGGKNLTRESAPAAVFGWCVGNDVTERAWQHRTPQWTLGKSFDTHAPFGPWITTADEVKDPHALDLRCEVNGELRQASNSRHLVFDAWAQVEHLSQAMTLEPGDVIFTGTPGGIGATMKPPRFLRPGDRVRCEVSGLGFLDNPIVAEA